MKIYQLKNQSPCQMMGYILVTDTGKVVAFDGGTIHDAELFRELLALHGNHLEYWFITHPHHDHYGVLQAISADPRGITADYLYYSPMDEAQISADNPHRKDHLTFYSFINSVPFTIKNPQIGDIFTIDNITIEVMGISNPEITEDVFNNNSCSFMITEKYPDGSDFKLLILGDSGIAASDKLLATHGKRLKADMVQMAHHGQNACEKRVYDVIAPRYSLWPTPDWLWTNTIDPAKPGEGPWKTLIVRGWMEELGSTPINSLEKTAIVHVDNGKVSVEYYKK